MSLKQKKLIYHLTAVRNLAAIAQHGLRSRAELARRRAGFTDVADPEILDGREDLGLDEMVPFHFKQRSPFDYAVAHSHAGEPFVLLTVQRTIARSRGYRIIPGHPLADGVPAEVLQWDEGYEKMPWDLLDAGGNWEENHALKMARMAEALSPGAVPFSDIFMIFVPNSGVEAKVRKTLGFRAGRLAVNAAMFPPPLQ